MSEYIETKTYDTDLYTSQWGYRGPCQTPVRSYSKSYLTQYSSVTSVRGGPVRKVLVGGKKRRVFRPFKAGRSHHIPTTMGYCGAPGYPGNAWIDDWFMHVYHTDPGNPTGDIPVVHYEQLESMMEPYTRNIQMSLEAKAREPKFATAVNLAELPETITGIKGLLQGAFKAFFKKGGNKGFVKGLVKNPEDFWLWYRYALMPAILSVNDLIEAFDWEAPDRVQDGARGTDLLSGTALISNFSTTFKFDWKTSLDYGLGGAIDMDFNNDPFPWGTGPIDVIQGMYAVIKFSFIFNWFVNLEAWLNQFRSVDFEIVQKYATTRLSFTTEIFPGDQYVWIGGGTQIASGYMMKRITEWDRVVYPPLTIQAMNLNRSIDSIALIIGMLKGVLRKKK